MNPRKLPTGRYQITFHDQTRTKRRESFDTMKEARDALAERRTAVRNKEYVTPAQIPTVEQAAQAWLEAKKISPSRQGTPIKETTIDYWLNHIDRLIVPVFGPYKLDVVSTSLIESKRKAWLDLGFSALSINSALRTFSAIFDKALKDKAVARKIGPNPVRLVDRMATGSHEVGSTGHDETSPTQETITEDQVYNPEQVAMLIRHAEPGFAYTIFMTFALTGMRHGEALALMWSDVDFDGKTITVRRNRPARYRDEEPIFYMPKTKHSRRTISIPDELCLALKKWKLQCPPSKYDLVFPAEDGRPRSRKSAWNAFNLAVKRANRSKQDEQHPPLRRLTIHSLRHSFASIHLANGTPIPEVSAMLGHSNVNITLTVYTHFIPKMHTNAASRLAALIFSSPISPTSDQDGHQLDTSSEEAVNA